MSSIGNIAASTISVQSFGQAPTLNVGDDNAPAKSAKTDTVTDKPVTSTTNIEAPPATYNSVASASGSTLRGANVNITV